MTIGELIQKIDGAVLTGSPEQEIVSVEYDSRKIRPGALFVAIRGYSVDGNRFIGEAVKRGVVGVVTDDPAVQAETSVFIRVPDARKALAVMSSRILGDPQESLIMTAVTGTNGKTTTTYMVKSIFEAAGLSCGLIGTIAHEVAGVRRPSLNTTPESRDIHQMLAEMVAAGQHACIMEASSHALTLSRVYGIRFRAVAFTNITRDHLDFHGTFEEYLEAKSILFSGLSGDATAVVNSDDPYAEHIIAHSRGGKVLTYGFGEKNDIYPTEYVLTAKGSDITLATPSGTIACRLPIPGAFNISNAMAAAGIALGCGIAPSVIEKGLAGMPMVKGRYEIIDEGQPFTVIIDYAHTPDALGRILTSAREITKGRLIVVFGCGGDRDRGKRPQMGAQASTLADFTIVTSDNPRTEDPAEIIREIVGGIPEMAQFKTFIDREEGIMEALKFAGPEDTVVIAGKGHEDYQIVGSEKLHFDDAESVRRLIKAMEWKATHCTGF
jgi:UDP-N-acetylmuramoyl-L-alanyl-D-glutamate--2,6-diaminopimelate ligase